MNTYGAGFFNAVAVNAIVSSGYTIGEYFDNKLKNLSPTQMEAEVSIKDKDERPQYKALVSRHFYQAKLIKAEDISLFEPKRVQRSLRNIGDGKKYACVKLSVPFEL